MENQTIVLFGESQKGEFETAYYCETLPELEEFLGNPPPATMGLHLAVQALLYHFNLIFFKVREEGYSYQDYFLGLRLLQSQRSFSHLAALGIPGVGNHEIIQVFTPFCSMHHTVLIMSESDLFDYLSS